MFSPYSGSYFSHTATTYPYAKENSSFLFVDGAIYPYTRLTDSLTENSSVAIPGGLERAARTVIDYFHPDEPTNSSRTPVIAYGANAAVQALVRKFVTDLNYEGSRVVPVTRLTLNDLDVVWAAHFVGNGAVPATIAPSPGTQVATWVTWLDDDQLRQMHRTEAVTDYYAFGTLPPQYIAASDVQLNTSPGVYVDCYGALVKDDGKYLAVKNVQVENRVLDSIDAISAMNFVGDLLNWTGSGYELIVDNLKNPETARQRERELRPHADFTPIVGFDASITCAI